MKKNQKIMRFPRLDHRLTLTEKFEERIRIGDIPKRYDRLSKKQKKVAKLVASGETIHDACRRPDIKIRVETFYRWRRAHPLFRAFLNKCILSSVRDADSRAARQIQRALRVVDNTLDDGDVYLQADMAKAVLKGRGIWQASSTVQQRIGGAIHVDAKVEEHGASRETMELFVNALIGLVSGKPIKTLEIEEVPGARKALQGDVEGETPKGSPASE